MHTLDSAKKYYEELLDKIEQTKSDLDGFIKQKENFVQSVKQQLGSDFVAEMFGQEDVDQTEAVKDPRVGRIITAENWDEMYIGDTVECLAINEDNMKIALSDNSYLVGSVYVVGMDNFGDVGPLDYDQYTPGEDCRTGFKFRILK